MCCDSGRQRAKALHLVESLIRAYGRDISHSLPTPCLSPSILIVNILSQAKSYSAGLDVSAWRTCPRTGRY
jgi:hypothetical protein